MKLYDKDNHEIGTGTAGDDGVATITVANNIPVGNVTAKATDASGNVSDPSAPKGATDTTKPISSNGVDENGNLIAPPRVDIPEFNGGVKGNGDNKPQPTPEVPTDNTERKPEVVTPDEQPAETENTTTKPKASQNILPNTGTAKGLGIFSAAAASILSGLGLVVFGKKEDEEEE